MRILAIADPHGNYSSIEAMLKQAGKIDAVMIAGDITNFGPDERANDLIDMFEQPVLAVPGNCDHTSILEVLDSSSGINMHNNMVTIDQITFVGIGGSNPTPFCTPFELEEEEISEKIDQLVAKAEDTGYPIVLLTHAPPRGILDDVGDVHVGCHAFANHLDKVKLIVCGHIHEARGIIKNCDTVIVNPGMASGGSAAIIELLHSNGELEIHAKLIKV
ncbi:metallophosphoesterase [Methanolobus sp. ZRKC3]|uniref:metallophosphoesterase family protein n=1 Tax=Methanolobus sp. ZRKC3 TaxID=3125786 RepID=UPI00324BBA96